MDEMKWNLQLFADGEGGGLGGGEGTGEGTNENAGVGGRRANPLANVSYGRGDAEDGAMQEAQENEQGAQDVPVDLDREFEQLIKGKYKDQFAKRTQGIIDNRFKESKALEQRARAYDPIMQSIARKYGIEDASDLKAIQSKLDEDDSTLEREADDRGLTVKQLREVKRLEAENNAFRQAEEMRKRQADTDATIQEWMRQGEELKSVYADFDMKTEANSPTGQRFMDLLGRGLDVRTAYEVVHKDELLSGAIGYAVQTAQKRTMDSIRAKSMRPKENGSGGSVGNRIVKSDPTKFTKMDREEISRRVLRGEKIVL